MTGGPGWLYGFAAVWAVAMLAVFVRAIRLSCRIEARSPDLVNRSGLPRFAAIPFTATNFRVARDPQTQALRRRMNLHLLATLAGFALLWFGIVVAEGE